MRSAPRFHAHHAEEFVHYLRTTWVASNRHPRAPKRPLLDKGIKYALKTCRVMPSDALRCRHLSSYAEDPFSVPQIERIPVENTCPIVLWTPEQERLFLETCDRWQFPAFLTLKLTEVRPGGLAHLLLREDFDLQAGSLRIRNKPRRRWQVKTRNERDIPLTPVLVEVMCLAMVMQSGFSCIFSDRIVQWPQATRRTSWNPKWVNGSWSASLAACWTRLDHRLA